MSSTWQCFTKADVRWWVKLTNTALVKLLHHVYVLISPGIQLIDTWSWFIPGYSISNYMRAELTVYKNIYNIDIFVPIKEMFITTLYMYTYVAQIRFKPICVLCMCKLTWPRVYRGFHACAQEYTRVHTFHCWVQYVWHTCGVKLVPYLLTLTYHTCN